MVTDLRLGCVITTVFGAGEGPDIQCLLYAITLFNPYSDLPRELP